MGIAQPGAGCRRTSHSSGQSQSVTKTNVGKRTLSQAKGNNEYFSLLADAFVLAANAEVHCKKGYCADKKMCVSKCLHKAARGGQANSKGKGPLEPAGFSGTPPIPASLLASDLTALNQFSSWRCGSMPPSRKAAAFRRRGAQVARGWSRPPRAPGRSVGCAVHGVEGIRSHPTPYCQGLLN